MTSVHSIMIQINKNQHWFYPIRLAKDQGFIMMHIQVSPTSKKTYQFKVANKEFKMGTFRNEYDDKLI